MCGVYVFLVKLSCTKNGECMRKFQSQIQRPCTSKPVIYCRCILFHSPLVLSFPTHTSLPPYLQAPYPPCSSHSQSPLSHPLLSVLLLFPTLPLNLVNLLLTSCLFIILIFHFTVHSLLLSSIPFLALHFHYSCSVPSN